MLDKTSSNHIDQLFNYLDEFRKLPAYQLERRADIFFALYLKEILQENLNVKIDTFIPEFPLKVDRKTVSGKSINLSNKVDYLAISRDSNKIFLIELKTEKSSLRTIQNDYLVKAQANGLHNLLLNLKAIYDASRQKNKYKAILPLIQDLQWLDQELKPILDEHYDIEIVYIIPSLDSLLPRYKIGATFITFTDIIKTLEHHSDHLTQRFLESLNSWIPQNL